jgi:hypothetical protein
MSTIVYRISVLLSAILVNVPVGTNLGLFWLLWALISGRFLLSRGAVFPALADGGLSADAVRRSGAALASGRWTIETLVRVWHHVVQQEGRWHAHCHEGFRPVACDLVGFFRPRLSGCLGKHYQSGADKALPAVVLAVVAAVGSVGKVRLPLVRLLLRADPDDQREADLQHRAITQAGAALHPDEVLVVDAGFGVAALLTGSVPRFVARVARNFTARRNVLPASTGRGRRPPMGRGCGPYPAPTKAAPSLPRARMPPPSGWALGGRSRPKSGRTSCSRRRSQAPRRFGVR